MSKEKNRTIDVDVDGKTVKIVVRRPSGSINTKASRVAAKIWNECVSDGIMTKKELSEFMKKRNIWDKDKADREQELLKSVSELEKKLAFGTGKGGRVKASEGKETAIEIREKIVLPLITIQQYALRKIKDIESGKINKNQLKTFEKMVTRSLFGNINASRNSA